MNQKKYYHELMSQMQISPKRKFGQNFLHDQNIINKIIFHVRKNNFKKIVEIGPGLGALTFNLLKLTNDLLLVELDPKLAHFWNNKQNVKVINDNILKVNLLDFISPPFNVVSNLPYNIASRFLVDSTLKNQNHHIDKMILMVQKEVGEKILTKVNDSNYGFLSVFLNTFWKIEKLFLVRPNSFFPPPKVDSIVLKFSFSDRFLFIDRERYCNLLKISFLYRRKFLLKNLKENIIEYKKNEKDLLLIFDKLLINKKSRAQELAINKWIELFKELLK